MNKPNDEGLQRPGEAGQLDLFGEPRYIGAKPEPVGAAPADTQLVELSRGLPAGLRMGTSSWSFPGWAGIVYDREVRRERLARHGLSAYAKHPLFRTVGLDRTYYGPPRIEEYARYARSVPDDFRFVIKAHDWLSIVRFPQHPRYGERAGRTNPFFLDPSYASQEVVGPAIEGLGDKLGVVLVQFPPQELALISDRGKFPARLEQFLNGLPSGPTYAIEIRNHQLFTPRYLSVLREHSAVHCLNVHPSMHEIGFQIRHAQPLLDRAIVVRWMLARHLRYEEAKASYSPFDCLVDPDVQTRASIAQLCRDAAVEQIPMTIVVNNKAEGSSPMSIIELAKAIGG